MVLEHRDSLPRIRTIMLHAFEIMMHRKGER
jgi:hypothetical protein